MMSKQQPNKVIFRIPVQPPTFLSAGGGGREVLPYMALTGMCCQIGYGFQGIFVLTGVLISQLCVNRISLYLNGKHVHLHL